MGPTEELGGPKSTSRKGEAAPASRGVEVGPCREFVTWEYLT